MPELQNFKWAQARACGLTTTSIAVSLVQFRVAQIRNASNQGLQICRRNTCFTTHQYGIAKIARDMKLKMKRNAQIARLHLPEARVCGLATTTIAVNLVHMQLLRIRNVTIARLHVPAARPCLLTTTTIAVSLVHIRLVRIRNANKQGLQIIRRYTCFTTNQSGTAKTTRATRQNEGVCHCQSVLNVARFSDIHNQQMLLVMLKLRSFMCF